MSTGFIITTFISILGLCIAALSAWYSKKATELSIKLHEEEEAEKSKANIIAHYSFHERGNHVVSFVNIGKADAVNIRCDFSEAENNSKIYVINGKNLFPFASLSPNCSINIVLLCVEGGDDFANFTVTWDDGFKANNIKRLTVPLI